MCPLSKYQRHKQSICQYDIKENDVLHFT